MSGPIRAAFLMSILMLLGAALPVARLVRSVHRSRTHARIERGMIDPHQVQVLRFRTVNGRILDHDLSWKKPGREFSYQGRMHDVVRTFHLDNEVVLHCFEDGMDTALSRIGTADPAPGRSLTHQRIPLPPRIVLYPMSGPLVIPVRDPEGDIQGSPDLDRLPERSLEVALPPPRA